MAFETIVSTLYDVGKAIRKELFSKIVGNLNDLDARQAVIEQGANKIVIWDDEVKIPNDGDSLTGLDFWRAPSDFTLLEARVSIYTIGTATGPVEFDIKKGANRDDINMSTVFVIKPSVDYSTASDYDESTNFEFIVAQQAVTAGQWLRLDISALPSTPKSFHVFLIGEFN